VGWLVLTLVLTKGVVLAVMVDGTTNIVVRPTQMAKDFQSKSRCHASNLKSLQTFALSSKYSLTRGWYGQCDSIGLADTLPVPVKMVLSRYGRYCSREIRQQRLLQYLVEKEKGRPHRQDVLLGAKGTMVLHVVLLLHMRYTMTIPIIPAEPP